jgi:hypothetical protein
LTKSENAYNTNELTWPLGFYETIMRAPTIPADDVYRLMALRSLDLLDTAPEQAFDDIVQLAASIFDVPICLISLVDEQRQWFKARAGLDATETSRDLSFCGHAIHHDEPLVVLNALEDSRFADNPLVTGPPNIRFYSGAPIILPNGYRIGTLCLISPQGRERFDYDDIIRQQRLTNLVVNVIGKRAITTELLREQQEVERRGVLLSYLDQPAALVGFDGTIELTSAAFPKVFGSNAAAGGDFAALLRTHGFIALADRLPDGGADGAVFAPNAVGLKFGLEADAFGYLVYATE